MKISTFICLFLLLIFNNISFAAKNMRQCMLLPVEDGLGGAIGYPVYEEMEAYLKLSDWCFYNSNSEIIDILKNYKSNLYEHLQNKEVLKIISEKTHSGSLIRTKIKKNPGTTDLQIDIIGENGSDLYFSEKTTLNTDDITIIAQTFKNWLSVYEKIIPYDGRVVGVLGDQFTVDAGRALGVFPDIEVEIIRPVKKRKHPLLKEIVEWETVKIADARIFHSSKTQSQGKTVEYMGKQKIELEDWVNVKAKDKQKVIESQKFDEGESFKFGKLGVIGLHFVYGSGSLTVDSSNTKKIGGSALGAHIKAELWATRNFWGSLDIGKSFGTYSKEEGSITSESNSASNSRYLFKLGYKYLPLGFFYGPQVDGYIGYAKFDWGLDTQSADGITATEFKGLLLGTRGSMPFMNVMKFFLELAFTFNANYDEEVTIYGEESSASNYMIEVGGSYIYSPAISFELAFNSLNSKASFENLDLNLKLKENVFKLGASFTF